MSARSGDWQLLGHDSDPVPGDSSQIADAGEHYSSIATTISGQVQRLRQLEADDEILKGTSSRIVQGVTSDEFN